MSKRRRSTCATSRNTGRRESKNEDKHLQLPVEYRRPHTIAPFGRDTILFQGRSHLGMTCLLSILPFPTWAVLQAIAIFEAPNNADFVYRTFASNVSPDRRLYSPVADGVNGTVFPVSWAEDLLPTIPGVWSGRGRDTVRGCNGSPGTVGSG